MDLLPAAMERASKKRPVSREGGAGEPRSQQGEEGRAAIAWNRAKADPTPTTHTYTHTHAAEKHQ